jgi:diguanylate cyclase (GGDEF)-like protein/PAS domain S-box-containing protein
MDLTPRKTKEPGERSALWPVLLWVGLVALVALAVSYDISRLYSKAADRREVAELLAHVEAETNEQFAAEGHALSHPADLDHGREEIEETSEEIDEDFERIEELDPGPASAALHARVASYEELIGSQFALLEQGRTERVRARHESLVDPRFEDLHDLLEEGRERGRREAEAAEVSAQRRSLLSLLLGLAGMALPLAGLARARRRARAAARAAELAAAREQAIGDSERRFRALVQNASDAIVVLSDDGRVKALLGSTTELLGYPPEELVGRPLWRIVHPADADLAAAFCREAGVARVGAESMEWRIHHADGSWGHFDVATTDLSDDPAVGGLVLTLRDVSRRKELEDQLRHRAFHDPLTHLPNRALFLDRVEHALARGHREGGAAAVLFVDLDDFKLVNDSLGHAVGDELLLEAGKRLRSCVRSADTAARLGGDEFGILIEGVTSESEPVQAADRVLAVMREPFLLGGQAQVVRASIGVALSDDSSLGADDLMRRADLAMYAAKAHGKARYELFDSALEAAFGERDARGAEQAGDRVTFFMRSEEQRAEIESLLARADSPRMVVQPVIDLRTGFVAGYEALSRFPDSQRPPNAWFAQAHRFALGSRLEARALERALALPDRPAGAFLSINLSPTALVSEEVWDALPAELDGVVIEVTEHELAFRKETLTAAIRRLRDRGARLAVDDAGSGYAGLKQLMFLDPDVIKLDRTLVDGVASDEAKGALIESFTRYARRIGADVCAEGVETLADMGVLAELDVTFAQGYAIARPGEAWPEIEVDAAAVFGGDRSEPLGAEAPGGRPEYGDRALERIVGALAGVRRREELNGCMDLVASELGASEVTLSLLDREHTYVESVSGPRFTLDGSRFMLADYPATERVLREQQTLQVIVGDAHADPAEVELLRSLDIGSLLMVPVLAAGRTVGLLEAYTNERRPWSRAQMYRARIVAYQLGGVLLRVEEDRRQRAETPSQPTAVEELIELRRNAAA